jgi:aryl-phospho-beta-D-glucosidase BglC (GH1 family)
MRVLVVLTLSIPLLAVSASKFTSAEFTLPDNLLRDGTDGSNHVCPSVPGQENVKMNNFHYRGAALGGWLVLEPWITPSLFYQFLGASQKWGDEAPDHVGLDSMSFCQALGPEEANLQLRRHWKTWVTEQEIADLRVLGADTLRLPVGDWMYVPVRTHEKNCNYNLLALKTCLEYVSRSTVRTSDATMVH